MRVFLNDGSVGAGGHFPCGERAALRTSSEATEEPEGGGAAKTSSARTAPSKAASGSGLVSAAVGAPRRLSADGVAKASGGSARVGMLTSAYPFGMLAGLAVWPRLSDKRGMRKPILVLSLGGVGLGLAAQSAALARNAPLWTFLSLRALSGACGGASPVAKAYLADAATGDQLPRWLAWREAAATPRGRCSMVVTSFVEGITARKPDDGVFFILGLRVGDEFVILTTAAKRSALLGERAALVDAAEHASLVSNILFTAAHQKLIYTVSLAFYRHAAAQARLKTAVQSLKKVQEGGDVFV